MSFLKRLFTRLRSEVSKLEMERGTELKAKERGSFFFLFKNDFTVRLSELLQNRLH